MLKKKYYSEKLQNANETIYIGEPQVSLTLSSGTHKFYACAGTITITSASVTVFLEQSPELQITNSVRAKTYRDGYGIGNVIISENDESPTSRFGGVWNRFAQGRTLVGAGTSDATYTAGATGGTSTQKHSAGNITADIGTSGGSYLTFNINNALNSSYKNFKLVGTTTPDYNSTNMDGVTTHGETASASNLPPYYVVYMWKRINYEDKE